MSLFIGVMSGTSLDGIDVAIVDLKEHDLQVIAADTYPFTPELRNDLLKLITTSSTSLHQLGQVDTALGHAYAQAINQLLSETQINASDIHAIGCHGQTICHAPAAQYPFSMQIGNNHVISALTGITTVGDFRQMDMVWGGQGAPLVPAFHQYLFQHNDENRVIANIGGISNITILPESTDAHVSGFDTGPGNVLMDQWFQLHHQRYYDENGQWARGGEVDPELLHVLLADPYFSAASPKSTGREYFNINWLQKKLVELDKPIKAPDVQRTLLTVTVTSLVNSILKEVPECHSVFVCGGGAHNEVLMKSLADALHPISVETTNSLGLAPDWVEACAFAWLAERTINNKSGNLPAVTGASKACVLGAIYPSSADS